MSKDKRGFEQFKGLTIANVDATCQGFVEFTFTNGQTLEISMDTGELVAFDIQGFAATHEVIHPGGGDDGDYYHSFEVGDLVRRMKGTKDFDGDFQYVDLCGTTQFLKKSYVKKL